MLLVLLKYLLSDFELLIDILLLIIDEGGIIVKIVPNKWLKRGLVVGVTIVTYNINQERSALKRFKSSTYHQFIKYKRRFSSFFS